MYHIIQAINVAASVKAAMQIVGESSSSLLLVTVQNKNEWISEGMLKKTV